LVLSFASRRFIQLGRKHIDIHRNKQVIEGAQLHSLNGQGYLARGGQQYHFGQRTKGLDIPKQGQTFFLDLPDVQKNYIDILRLKDISGFRRKRGFPDPATFPEQP